MATNLENLNLSHCSSLVELPCSIKYLTKLDILEMSDCVNLLTLPSGVYLRTLSVLNVSGCLLLKTFPDISTNIEQLILSETSIERFPSNLCLENLARLTMTTMKSDKLWEIKEPLTLLMNMVSPSLNSLFLSDISSLVELPSSIKILHKLKHLQIKNCKNLETLPTNINFENMEVLDLSGCSRLSTFPDISTNIKRLYLNHTSIEEVPWWIEKFSNLMDLNMIGCKELHSISSNISKARHPKLDIYDCSKVDREALIEKLSGFCESMMFSGEKVPSYFNYRTIGSSPLSLHILLPSPSRPRPIFKFIVGVVINCESIDPLDTDTFIILIRGQLVDSFNNGFSLDSRAMYVSHLKSGSQLVILDCSFSLSRNVPLSTELDLSGILLSGTMNIQTNKLNTNSIFEEYDVEEPPENEVQFKIKEWGIR